MIDLSTGNIYVSAEWEQMDPTSIPHEQRITLYEMLLAKALIMRASQRTPEITLQKQDKIFPYIKYTLEWLRHTDFYSSPASTKYHDSCHGGLLLHTLKVYSALKDLSRVSKFESVVATQWWSAVLVVLVHDWCKIGRYESYMKNVPPDDECPDWHQVPAYKYKDDNVGRFGHGPQSLVVAMQLFNNQYTSLTFEEMAAIRWHMNNWDASSYDVPDLRICNEKIPMVHMIQFADQLAITAY